MKKIICLSVFVIGLLLLCSCTKTDLSGKHNTVTAIAVYSGDNMYDYNFIVTKTSGELSKDNEENQNFMIYKITSVDFENAIQKYEEKFGRVNLGHLCDFFVDTNYIQNKLKTDFSLIRNRITVSPLVNFCVTKSNDFELFDIIGNNYEGNFQNFTERFFSGKRKSRICTLTELYLASLNTGYYASLPYLTIDNENIISDSGVIIYSSGNYITLMGNELKIYQKYIDRYSKSSKGFDITVTNKGFEVSFIGDNSDISQIQKIYNRYYQSGFDVFNIIYYAKRCFLTTDDYEKYLKTNPKLIFDYL